VGPCILTFCFFPEESGKPHIHVFGPTATSDVVAGGFEAKQDGLFFFTWSNHSWRRPVYAERISLRP